MRFLRSAAQIVLAAALLLFGLWLIGWVPTYGEYCTQSEHTGYKECTTYHITLLALRHIGKFLDQISPAITAIATGFVGWFTYTIWSVNKNQLSHTRAIERAYLVGGGGPQPNPPSHFVLNVNNYGKTPASIKAFAVHACAMVDVKLPNKPKYDRKVFIDEIAPAQFKVIDDKTQIPNVVDPVVYGRFWYRDIWKEEERYFSFILSIKLRPNGTPFDSRADIDLTSIDDEYTEWT
jgi:hypothetical protein